MPWTCLHFAFSVAIQMLSVGAEGDASKPGRETEIGGGSHGEQQENGMQGFSYWWFFASPEWSIWMQVERFGRFFFVSNFDASL